MPAIRSDHARRTARIFAAIAGLAAAAVLAAAPAAAQVLSSEYSISGSEAALRLDIAGGETLDIAIRDGGVYLGGERIGSAERGSELDRAWRGLLNRAMDTPAAQLGALFEDWSPEGELGARMDAALESAFANASAVPAPPVAPMAPGTDSVDRLVDRIAELESTIEQLESREHRIVMERPGRERSPFRAITDGIAGIFSLLVTYIVLFGIGVATIFFGGRKYLEGVGDTARRAPGRSLLVGMAGAFLVVPAFVLGIIALVISIIGIPALLVFVPAFPLAVVTAALLGYLGVAHALGEAFAERRFQATDWFQRGNSYYFLLYGIGLLLALFLGAQVIHMAGSWLSAVKGILLFLGVLSSILVTLTGFGAVLISRAGTEPVSRTPSQPQDDLFTEGAGV